MSDTLAEICARKRAHIAERKRLRPFPAIEAAARAAPPPRGFATALAARAGQGAALICEIKKASPSKGLIRADFDPAVLACAYAAGGAACLSVLTDTPYFMGRDEDLVAARAAVDLPVLRKDFMLDPYQIAESRALGADCVLLILAALDDAMARDLAGEAASWGMDVLLEVHDAAELGRALALPGDLIGINNRNLKTLEVALDTTLALAPRVADGRPVVAESGFAAPDDLARLMAVGVQRFLIGESLMRQPDVAAAARRLADTRPVDPGVAVDPDRRAFRDALGRWPTGVAVAMTLGDDGAPLGITINSFASVSLEPPLVLWSIERTAGTAPAFLNAERFSVNVLAAGQVSLARRFALQPGVDGLDLGASRHGVPVLGGALATFVCRRDSVLDGGDHAILLGRVLDFTMAEGAPLVFHEGRFVSL